MTLENRMAKNVETVEKFEDDLSDRIHSQGIAEMGKLLKYKRKVTKDPKGELHNWDVSYYYGL
jgi:Zn-dependent oligopeptidase